MKRKVFKIIACVCLVACTLLVSTSCGQVIETVLDAVDDYADGFADSLKQEIDQLLSGSVDVELSMKREKGDDWSPVKDGEAVFSDNAWEPGRIESVVFMLENELPLEMSYSVVLDQLNVTELGNVVDVYFRMGDGFPDGRELTDYIYMGTVNECVEQQLVFVDGSLSNDSAIFFSIVLKMREDVSSEYQGAELSGVTVKAAVSNVQVEDDDFGAEYNVPGAEFDEFND